MLCIILPQFKKKEGNYIQHFVITFKGKESEKEYIFKSCFLHRGIYFYHD